MVESRIERGDKIETERRSYISSRALSAAAFAAAVRGHWAIENKLHWVLDVTFREDLSRLRAGHGASNMAVVRHFALNLVRQIADHPRSAPANHIVITPPPSQNCTGRGDRDGLMAVTIRRRMILEDPGANGSC